VEDVVLALDRHHVGVAADDPKRIKPIGLRLREGSRLPDRAEGFVYRFAIRIGARVDDRIGQLGR
jgi:hypothetical protein